jgi:hypothetical protein
MSCNHNKTEYDPTPCAFCVEDQRIANELGLMKKAFRGMGWVPGSDVTELVLRAREAEQRYAEAIADKAVLRDTHEKLKREAAELHGRLKQEAAMTQEHRDVIVELREKLKKEKAAWATAPDELRAARAVMTDKYGMSLEAGALPKLLEEQNRQMEALKRDLLLATAEMNAYQQSHGVMSRSMQQQDAEVGRYIADRDAARRERDEHKVKLSQTEEVLKMLNREALETWKKGESNVIEAVGAIRDRVIQQYEREAMAAIKAPKT